MECHNETVTAPVSEDCGDENLYTVCDTYEAAAAAAEDLRDEPMLVLECHGRSLGLPGGALSILAIGNCTASCVFLVDVLALSDKDHPQLAPLLDMLSCPDITKVVWDARTSYVEVKDAYGVQMEGVLDLQLAEVAQRGRNGRKPKGQRQGHTANYFKDIGIDACKEPHILHGIHRVHNLGGAAWLYQQLDGIRGTDEEVLSLIKENKTEPWMHRPLSSAFLQYSAHSVQLLSRLYARFKRKGGYLDYVDTLKEMSARHMQAYPSRELRAKHASLDLTAFVPMDVIPAPPDDSALYACKRCERMLSLSCFTTQEVSATLDTANQGETVVNKEEVHPESQREHSEIADRPVKRSTMCRLCLLLAKLHSEPSQVEWEDMTV